MAKEIFLVVQGVIPLHNMFATGYLRNPPKLGGIAGSKCCIKRVGWYTVIRESA